MHVLIPVDTEEVPHSCPLCRTHDELRKTLEHQLQASPSHSLHLSGRGLDMDLVDHLQQQLDTVTQERNSYEDLAKQSEEELKELRKLHHSLSETASGMKEALSHSKVLFIGVKDHQVVNTHIYVRTYVYHVSSAFDFMYRFTRLVV